LTKSAYVDAVHRVQDYISAGDVFQVNLARRFAIATGASPLDNYLRLREENPGALGGFFRSQDQTILCSSPELFLELRGRQVVTRPIKGTRPRSNDPRANSLNRSELAGSEKELAELNMIVDLMRNDLGRVCAPGSIRVVQTGEIEAHPTVYHRVATIEGTLRSNESWTTLLAASFPGGSITGAPKIRAMQIIDELEPVPRGIYCGSIGYIGVDGSMSLNIAIRTMVQRRHRVHVFAGSGIVADSDAKQEHEEIGAKARGMLKALRCEWPAKKRGVVTAP
jgi:para-aminobenzoate synthetase component 1